MMGRRRAASAALAVAAIATMTGCSQVAAIAPVGGDRLAEVRYAANDVLTEGGVEILTAPVCRIADSEPDDGAVACTGQAVDGQSITVASPSHDEDRITVTVGDTTLYDGPLLGVLEKASSR